MILVYLETLVMATQCNFNFFLYNLCTLKTYHYIMYSDHDPFISPTVGANTGEDMLPMPSQQVVQGMQKQPLNNGK